jgi:hypothetical protein
MFVGGLDVVPRMTQQIARLRDIARRVADDPQEGVRNRPDSPGVAVLAEPAA